MTPQTNIDAMSVSFMQFMKTLFPSHTLILYYFG